MRLLQCVIDGGDAAVTTDADGGDAAVTTTNGNNHADSGNNI